MWLSFHEKIWLFLVFSSLWQCCEDDLVPKMILIFNPQLFNFLKCFWPPREKKYFFFQKCPKYGLVSEHNWKFLFSRIAHSLSTQSYTKNSKYNCSIFALTFKRLKIVFLKYFYSSAAIMSDSECLIFSMDTLWVFVLFCYTHNFSCVSILWAIKEPLLNSRPRNVLWNLCRNLSTNF